MKTSVGVSRITVDNVASVLTDRETPRGSRFINYFFVRPESPDQVFSLVIADDIVKYKSNEAVIADMIKSLKISRDVRWK
ncbi:MAG: hypothetical protein HY913_00570 [Desulfomonile tiedjei]|nr:hypothetical protein [Desulfomonile tiedjei]